MYKKLTEKEQEMLKEISDITFSDYEVSDFIPVDNLLIALEELLYHYHNIQEELEDEKNRQLEEMEDE